MEPVWRRGLRGTVGGVLGWLVVGVAVGPVTAGCGPSPRRVYYAETYFERCAAADAQSIGTPDARRACWQGWLDHHVVGQSLDRIHYAERRVSFLGGEVVAPASPGEQEDPARIVELTEPPRARGEATGRTPDRSPPSPPAALEGVCASACTPDWHACVPRCEAIDAACFEACEEEFFVCVRSCP